MAGANLPSADAALVPRPRTSVGGSSSQDRRWQGRRTKDLPCPNFEDEDAASGDPGRRDAAEVHGRSTSVAPVPSTLVVAASTPWPAILLGVAVVVAVCLWLLFRSGSMADRARSDHPEDTQDAEGAVDPD